jgi:hypothetical protein
MAYNKVIDVRIVLNNGPVEDLSVQGDGLQFVLLGKDPSRKSEQQDDGTGEIPHGKNPVNIH